MDQYQVGEHNNAPPLTAPTRKPVHSVMAPPPNATPGHSSGAKISQALRQKAKNPSATVISAHTNTKSQNIKTKNIGAKKTDTQSDRGAKRSAHDPSGQLANRSKVPGEHPAISMISLATIWEMNGIANTTQKLASKDKLMKKLIASNCFLVIKMRPDHAWPSYFP